MNRGLLMLVIVSLSPLAATASVDDSAIASCRAERHRNIALARQDCAKAAASLQGAGQPLVEFEMLLHLSDAATAAADYATARRALTEAAALTLPPGHWEYDYRLLRRRGLLAFRSNDIESALTWLKSAARMAEREGRASFQAISANDLGMVLRRMGDTRGALEILQQSLAAQRRLPKPDLAPILNNIGDLHKDLHEWERALSHYTEALAMYEAAGKTRQVAHTVERLGLVAEGRGDLVTARDHLARAFAQFERTGAWADAYRVRGDQLRLALDAGDLVAARQLAAWQAAPQLTGEATLRLGLERARLLRLDGQAADAQAALERLLAGISESDRERAALLLERAEAVAAGAGQEPVARAWREALAAVRRQLEARYAESVAGQRVRYELSETEAALREARWRLWTGLAIAAVLTLTLVTALWTGWQRRRRLAAEAARQLAESRLRWQQAAQQLDQEQSRSHALLMRMASPCALIDSQGCIAACNPALAALLGLPTGAVEGQVFAALLDPASQPDWQLALAQADESGARVQLEVGLRGATRMLSVEALGNDATVWLLTLSVDAAERRDSVAPAVAAPEAEADEAADVPAEAAQFWSEPAHREALVGILVDALAAFERSTGKSRIELAERSRQWRVTVDDGRLRVRAMERYLSLARLPRLPRWREVLRTAYYVLAECELRPEERASLERRTQDLQAKLRVRALLPAA